MSLLDTFWQHAARNKRQGIWIHDESDAVVHELRYDQLVARAQGFARALHAEGIRRGEQVPLCATTSRAFPGLWLGLMWLGATPVPLPPRHAMTSDAAYRHRLENIFPYYERYICMAAEARHARKLFDDTGMSCRIMSLEQLSEKAQLDTLPEVACADLNEDDIAFVQYTSGSTRAPKGILVTYGNLLANVQAIVSHLEILPSRDVLISWLPLYHDMGLIGKFLTSVLNQNKLVLVAPHAFVRRPLQFLELIEQHAATICSMPNFAYDLLSRRLLSTARSHNLRSMKWFGVGAEPVRRETLATFEALAQPLGLGDGVVSPCYGLAEATLAVSMERPGKGYRVIELDGTHQVTCGEPLSDFELRVDEQTGEIRIRGASVARTALIDGKVQSIVDEEGFYGTKDRGVLVDGKLVVLGRIDEMFTVHGENRFPYDIEALVRDSVDDISRCVCVAVKASEEENHIVLIYERRPNLAPGDAERRERIIQAVLEHAGLQLDDVLAVPPKALPQTPSGKMQRVQAKALYQKQIVTREAQDTFTEIVS